MVQQRAGESRRPSIGRQGAAGRESRYAYLTLLPVLLIMAVFSLYPIGYSVYLSLHKEVLTDPLNHPFVGFQNFNNVLHSYYLISSLTSTLVFMVMAVPGVMVFGLLASLLLNESFAGARILRVAILLPWAMPAVISGIVWRWILNGDYGVLNSALFQLGIIHDYIPWLSSPDLARVGLAVAHVWREGPLAAIFFLAGLQTIPTDLYNSAAVDGAGRMAAFRRITLPLLRPTIVIVLIYETIVAATTFDLVYVMTGGGPADATSLISWYAYAEVFKFLDLGAGAALAFLIALALVGVILLYLRVLRTEEQR
ncbi:MAG TPA: sugar ABC transporter permease [Candidatus Limnocylindria bacterium]|nr:sugar ABC transporter permease [Candidatus Limnocylindria bacterium]